MRRGQIVELKKDIKNCVGKILANQGDKVVIEDFTVISSTSTWVTVKNKKGKKIEVFESDLV